MRRIITGIAFLCAWAGACVTSSAQITITAADVQAKLGVGNSLVTVNDTLTTSLNIGSPGATSFDFSGLLNHGSTSMTSVTPSTTPYTAQYPNATFALKASLAGAFSGIPGTVDGDLYTYLTLASNSLVILASMGSGTITLPGANPIPGALAATNDPPDTMYAVPMTIGTRWGSTYAMTTNITVGGFPFSNSTRNYVTTFVVDAYGPMKMPGGSVHDALRLRKADISGTPIISYTFLAKDGATVQVTASDPSWPDSGTITVARKYVTWTAGPPVSVRSDVAVPNEFSVSQNYPNPFNPETNIKYQIADSRMVQLTVYDLLGREVAVLVNEQKAPGTYDVRFDGSGLSSGVYLYRLSAGTFVETRKMVLVK